MVNSCLLKQLFCINKRNNDIENITHLFEIKMTNGILVVTLKFSDSLQITCFQLSKHLVNQCWSVVPEEKLSRIGKNKYPSHNSIEIGLAPQQTSTQDLKQISSAVLRKDAKNVIRHLLIHCKYACDVTTKTLIWIIR